MAVDLVSNVKLATSGTTPTTANLPKGYMAFGNFGGKNEVYGNVGSQVVKLNSDPKKVLYFASQNELDTFLKGSDVPVGEWYAAVAEKLYSQNYITVDVSGTLETGDSNKRLSLSNLQKHDFPYDVHVVTDLDLIDSVSIDNIPYGVKTYASIDVKGPYAGSIQHNTPRLEFVVGFLPDNSEYADAVYNADRKLFTWTKDNIEVFDDNGDDSRDFTLRMDGTWYETNECLINGTVRVEIANG